jgi:hypothetical protein
LSYGVYILSSYCEKIYFFKEMRKDGSLAGKKRNEIASKAMVSTGDSIYIPFDCNGN